MEHVPEPCGSFDCLNGPPKIETYALCETCESRCPNIYNKRLVPLPAKWEGLPKSEKESKRRAKDMHASSVMYFSVLLLQCASWTVDENGERTITPS